MKHSCLNYVLILACSIIASSVSHHPFLQYAINFQWGLDEVSLLANQAHNYHGQSNSFCTFGRVFRCQVLLEGEIPTKCVSRR